MVVVGETDYILFASERGAVDVVYRSRVVCCRVVAGIWIVIFLGDFRDVG